jgi:hypothetical protein
VNVIWTAQASGLAEWLTAFGTVGLAALTFVLAFVAIFPDRVKRCVFPPDFQVTTITRPPCCVAVKEVEIDSVYLRILVHNKGPGPAIEPEVYAEGLQRKNTDSSWSTVDQFPPMNLVWSNTDNDIYLKRLSPNQGRYCDVASTYEPVGFERTRPAVKHVTKGKTSLTFRLRIHPNHNGHIVGPGQYKLRISVAAENCEPQLWDVFIDLKGDWVQDAEVMLKDHVGIWVEEISRPTRWRRCLPWRSGA